ncbi:MAG: ABC transporter permease [Herpetosiphonaceae bacterium]|nr:ABC transporter permease [Herpetosiphonaceae bacterium]
MFGLLLLGIRRSLRNAPLTLTVFAGLLVLVLVLAGAPLYLAALGDVGLRAAIADAPLNQRGVRVLLQSDHLQQAEQARLRQVVDQTAQQAAWLKPTALGVAATAPLVLPGGYAQGQVALADADNAVVNLRALVGRLPVASAAGKPLEVVLGAAAADALGLHLGDQVALVENMGDAPLLQIQVVGLVEPADTTADFWQSHLLDLEPIISVSRRTATLVVAPGMLWTQVVPRLPANGAGGEYHWLVVFDLGNVNSGNVLQTQASIRQVVQATMQTFNSANIDSDFDTVVADYRHRLTITRAPLLLLFIEIAGLALIYLGWAAAFQAEATASEQAVLYARGGSVRQIAGVSGGQAMLLAVGAAICGIPLALVVLRVTTLLGPLAAVTRVHEVRWVVTPDAPAYALAAATAGFLMLAAPAAPAARRSIIALRQAAARPPARALWQRLSLDVLVILVAGVALVQLERQGSLLQQVRQRFEIDPALVAAPFLILVAGALIFLRLYGWLFPPMARVATRLRGFPLVLALVQLTRNRTASTRLVLLLSLTAGLGLFAQTFGANVVLNQRQRAGYLVGADARATLRDSQALLPGALPEGMHGTGVLRDTIQTLDQPGVDVPLLAVDPAQFATVAFNPPARPILPLPAVMDALGTTPPPDGLTLSGRPKQISLVLELGQADYRPAVILSDVAGSFHRFQLMPVSPAGPRQTFAAALDLPAAAFPVRLVALGLLPMRLFDVTGYGYDPPLTTITLGALAVDGTVVERWNGGAVRWVATTDAPVEPPDPAAGTVKIFGANVGILQGSQMRAALLVPNPQEVTPVPVAVDEQFLQSLHLKVGSTTLFTLQNRTVPVRIVTTLTRFPSLAVDGQPFVIADGPRLLRFLNRSFAPAIEPNELWLTMPNDPVTVERLRHTPGVGTVVRQADMRGLLGRDPLTLGIAGVFFLGFITSIGLTALGFATALYLTGQRRRVEFAVLQAIGLDQGGVLRTLATEQGILVLLALLVGTGLGAGLDHLILPLMAISDRGRTVVPPYIVIVPWGNLALTYTALIVLFAAITGVVLWLLQQRGIGRTLRIGED